MAVFDKSRFFLRVLSLRNIRLLKNRAIKLANHHVSFSSQSVTDKGLSAV